MSEAPTLESKLETRQIPRFDIPSTKTREDYLGLKVEVRRASSDRAAVSLHRLLNLLGPPLLKLFSWSDDNAPTPPGVPKALANIMNMDFSSDATKTFVLTQALPVLKEQLDKLETSDLLFHVDNLLCGYLTVGGVLIETRAELDETGISVTALLPLLYDALEVNYFPTFADPDTESGTGERSAHVEESTTNRKKRAQKRQSTRDAKGRAGRSALTLKN